VIYPCRIKDTDTVILSFFLWGLLEQISLLVCYLVVSNNRLSHAFSMN